MWRTKRKLFLRPIRASKLFFAYYDVILKIKDGSLSSESQQTYFKTKLKSMFLQVFWQVLGQRLVCLMEMIDYNEE